MLNNLKRKRVQRIDIEEWQYYNLKSDFWWKGAEIGYSDKNITIARQRYSKKKMKQSFDNLDIAPTRIYVKSMILCPSGTFTKGSNDRNDFNPIEEKKIEKPFLLGETEITQELYQVVMNVENPNKFKDRDKRKNPVENVSWYDAVMFCNKMSDLFGLERYYTIGNAQEIRQTDREIGGIHYKVETNKNSKGFRLPTEWEWEYAAKAKSPFLYSGSDDVNEVGWYWGNSKINNKRTVHPVKGKKPNAWGFYDMTGNVAEWCEDKSYPDDESISAARVFRGGSWNWHAPRLSCRNHASPTYRYDYLGFRVARYI